MENKKCTCGNNCTCSHEEPVPAVVFDHGVSGTVIESFGADSEARDALYYGVQELSTDSYQEMLHHYKPEIKQLSQFIVDADCSSGFVNDKDGFIGVGEHNIHSGRLINGLAVDKESIVQTVVGFTENNGFRNIGMNDMGEMIDLGPVVATTIVGTKYVPSAIIVPMFNIDAIKTANEIMNNALDAYNGIPSKPATESIESADLDHITSLL